MGSTGLPIKFPILTGRNHFRAVICYALPVVEIDGYAYLVSFVETEEEVFLKTVIPSRKATRKYFGREKMDEI